MTIIRVFVVLMVVLMFKGMATEVVDDPCPPALKDSPIVADMCESVSLTENTATFGNPNVDSVVLRVLTLEDQCVCRLLLINQTMTENISIIKYENQPSAAPDRSPCGLALNMEVIEKEVSENIIGSLNCKLAPHINVSLITPRFLRFTSIITDGTFTRGYCLQIYRATPKALPIIKLECDLKNETDNKAPTSTSLNTQTSTLLNIETTSLFQSSSTVNATESVQSKAFDYDVDTGLSQTLYIGIGVASAVVLLIIIVAVILVILRTRTKKKPKQSSSHINETFEHDDDSHKNYDDGLKNNVLYVPSDEFSERNGTPETAIIYAVDNTTLNDTDRLPTPELRQQSIQNESYEINKEESGYLNTQSPQHLSPNISDHVYSVVQKRGKALT